MLVKRGRLQQREFETREGEKRSVIEIVADEIGASLRWATVQIERTTRSEGGGGSAPRPASGGGGGGDRPSEPYYAGDEEPF